VSDTISVLSIKKYGFIQQLNFIQLGIVFCISGYLFSQQLTTTSSKKTLKKMLIFCIIFIFLIVVFPTDDFHQVSSLSDMTLHGAIHLLALLIFFLVAPIGVYYLSRVLDKEPVFGKFAKCTAITGYITTCLCYGWTFLFLSGSYLQYLGLFQKIIVLIALGWFLKLMYIMKKNLLLS
jgi:hypothetical protein